MNLSDEKLKYLRLLAAEYPSEQAVCREIINLTAILNLPKGTEHFMSDLHGEYEAFYHILNNCSGVIREKVDTLFEDRLSENERSDICVLIYYPAEKMNLLKKEHKLSDEWYRMTLKILIELAKYISSKYTRSKVRKALPEEFGYIIDELIHAQDDEDDNRLLYHEKILDTIIGIDNADEFIIALSALIKRLAVDHLHIVGDIFDRGANADKILDLLMKHHSIDIEWGNHDILWMGAAAGSEACIARALYNNIKYRNMNILESSYGISLSSLILFAEKTYKDSDPIKAAVKALAVIMLKLDGQIIKRHPEYDMDDRLLLHKVNTGSNTIEINGKTYNLKDADFPTVSPNNPYELSEEEAKIMDKLKTAFQNSRNLHKHIKFLYEKGSMYKCFNGNLLYHGCIPLDESGNFDYVNLCGKTYKGKEYFDYADEIARRAYFEDENSEYLDFMWYLWCGKKSPLLGRNMKTFERTYIEDRETWIEEKNPYYNFYRTERTCGMILREFGLFSPYSHIINGHTPIKVKDGESPIRANNRLIIIDGGFCKAYQNTTGIAGYTLIFNSHGMRLKAHQPFESEQAVLNENRDIESTSNTFETSPHRVYVKEADNGKQISETIEDLKMLLDSYRQGIIKPNSKNSRG